MQIRTAQSGDEKNIADVIVNTWKDAYRDIVPDSFINSLTTEKHEKLFRENIKNGTETILVLVNPKNQIIGVVCGGQDRSGIYDCELVAIYILSDYQKRGYGKWLFRELIEEHKKNQYRSMIIWTFRDNKDRQFYKSLGGLVREEKNIPFDGIEIAIVGYTWKDINEIEF